MILTVNGNEVDLPQGATLGDLLETLELGTARVAIELNHSIVPRSLHAVQTLQAGDSVEIVHAIGGG